MVLYYKKICRVREEDMEESVLQSVSIDIPVGVRVYNDIEHKFAHIFAYSDF